MYSCSQLYLETGHLPLKEIYLAAVFSTLFFLFGMKSQEGVIDEPRFWISSPASPSICSGSNTQKGPKSSMLHVMEAWVSQPLDKALGALVSSARLHASLSLNTWRVKPEGMGWGWGVGVGGGAKLNRRRRRRGDARKDPKCFDLSVRWVCGCMNLRPLSHLSFLSL